MTQTPKPVRCAIYTRKSTEEGLDQEFNTLDAQRESGEAYIKSQQHEGWECLPELYDDGGFTGGNMERPALQRLLKDVEDGKIDCVIVYKVDRLSRSLLDFAKILRTFEKHQVAFCSVTQQLNSATSIGRLMLNVLLSFAQFERELISERTRDNDCRIDAVTFNDIMLDFGASCGEYAMESQAYSIFKRIAELNNVTFTSEPYDGDESLLVVHVDGVEIRDDE